MKLKQIEEIIQRCEMLKDEIRYGQFPIKEILELAKMARSKKLETIKKQKGMRK